MSELADGARVVRGSEVVPFSQEGFTLLPGLTLEGVTAEQLWLGIFRTDSGFRIPPHLHTSETAAFLMRGRAAFTIGDDRREIAAGDWFYLPANVVHTEETVGDEAAEFVFITPVEGLTPVFQEAP